MMKNSAAVTDQYLALGNFRLLRSQRMLMCGDRRVRIGSRALDVLLELVEQPGVVVSKRQLMERVWSGVAVEEGALRVHILALRKILGDSDSGGRYIETVTGRGYRLVAPVAVTGESDITKSAMAQPDAGQLPLSLNRVLGRAEVVTLLAKQVHDKRFVTIVGTGGVGKTAVALTLAEQLRGNYEHGVCWVDLASVSEPQRIVSAVASAMAIHVPSEDPLAGLVAHLASRQMLVVFDNCEHLAEAAALLVETILRKCTRINILATSREPLRAEGEWVRRLSPLTVPPRSDLGAAAALDHSSVQLFAQRALANDAHFELRDEDVPMVVDICRRLDGLPLALELAAANMEQFGLRGIAARLDDRLHLLRTGRRTALPRHRTLRATLDWSYDILPLSQQQLLRRLAVFPRKFNRASAIHVAAFGGLNEQTAADALGELTAKSLVVARVEGDDVCYRLLETTRAYALDKLASSDEHALAQTRHAEICDHQRPAAFKQKQLSHMQAVANETAAEVDCASKGRRLWSVPTATVRSSQVG